MGLNNGGHSVTKKTCPDSGHWLGNKSSPIFTVIDTPGLYAGDRGLHMILCTVILALI